MSDAIARPAPGDALGFPQPARRPPLRALLPALEPLSGAHLLDVGCGIGSLLRVAAERGAIPAGVDRSAALLEIARWALPDADLRVGDTDAIPFDANTFDVVTAFTLPCDRPVALTELARVVRPYGRVIVGHWGPAGNVRPRAAGLQVLVERDLEYDGDVFHYLVATREL
jgi:ubiquinone/menaquinone biosynthesis C-methylase UbiE